MLLLLRSVDGWSQIYQLQLKDVSVTKERETECN